MYDYLRSLPLAAGRSFNESFFSDYKIASVDVNKRIGTAGSGAWSQAQEGSAEAVTETCKLW
jgi:hypothetical protein